MKTLMILVLVLMCGCATNPNLTAAQQSDIRLRFFLGLMEAGSVRGSTFAGNVGASGRNALDVQRVYEQQNIQNRRRLQYGY